MKIPCKDCLLLPTCLQKISTQEIIGFKLKNHCDLIKDYIELGSRKTKYSTILVSKRLYEIHDFYKRFKNI